MLIDHSGERQLLFVANFGARLYLGHQRRVSNDATPGAMEKYDYRIVWFDRKSPGMGKELIVTGYARIAVTGATEYFVTDGNTKLVFYIPSGSVDRGLLLGPGSFSSPLELIPMSDVLSNYNIVINKAGKVISIKESSGEPTKI